MGKETDSREVSEPDVLELRNANGIINIGPCHVTGAAISADGANADCDIYDGVGSNGEKKMHLETLSGTSFNLSFLNDVKFRKGIYIVVNASTTIVMISFHTAEFNK